MSNLTEFQQKAAAAALARLFEHDYFDITGLRKIADLTGAKHRLAGKDFEALEALHCVHYSKMGRGLAEQVRAKCLELLGLPPMTIDAECQREPEQPKQERRLRIAFWK
jgi:hypothetical protein